MNSTPKPKRLALEVQFQAQPIHGRLYAPEGSRDLDRRFSGWLGLISAIEAARGADPAARQDREAQ
jgi:hypothetical protein